MNVLQRKTNHNTFAKILTKKDANNEADYEEPSVTHELQKYFNLFECVHNLLSRIDATYEKACMATPRDKYYENMLETIDDYNYGNNTPLSNEKLRQAIGTVMAETEA